MCILIFRYNNRTYRVDDIDWDKNPTSTFTIATGEEISFIDYYEKVSTLSLLPSLPFYLPKPFISPTLSPFSSPLFFHHFLFSPLILIRLILLK